MRSLAVWMSTGDIAALPVSLLDRFAGDLRQQLLSLLRFLAPLTGGVSCEERAFGTTAMHAF